MPQRGVDAATTSPPGALTISRGGLFHPVVVSKAEERRAGICYAEVEVGGPAWVVRIVGPHVDASVPPGPPRRNALGMMLTNKSAPKAAARSTGGGDELLAGGRTPGPLFRL
jgi:hypothetical protein